MNRDITCACCGVDQWFRNQSSGSLDAAAQPDWPADIAVVISNRRDAYGLERARKAVCLRYGFPTETRTSLSSRRTPSLFGKTSGAMGRAGWIYALTLR